MGKKYIAIWVATLFYSTLSFAGNSPLAFSILPPIQFPADDTTVTGGRFSLIWGNHRNVYGMDLGVIGNTTDLTFGGFALSGLFNINWGEATVTGFQIAGVANANVDKARIYGLQLALGLNSNQAESQLVGLQAALANLNPFTDMVGVQVGIFNRARSMTGLQIGLVNVTEVLHGVQIGLANFHNKGLFSVAPLLNIGF